MKTPAESVDIYERLADALDALPHGFARTPSGVELRLIKMAFTEEEVWLAGQLTRFPETAAAIATRVGRDVGDVTATLESLIPRRLVRLDSPGMAAPGLAPTVVGEKKYRLGPFLVGWYEAMMRLQDKEFAALFEQFVIDGGGERIFAPRPGVLGVVPVRGSIKPEYIAREPHLDIDAHFQRHDRFLVIECVCKKEKAAAHGHSCALPIKRCGFVGMPPVVPLSENVIGREEAIKLWNELDGIGTMVVEGFYGFTMGAEAPQFVGGCHCCGCCCSILNAARLAPLEETIQRANYRVVKDYDKCHSCGECVRRCQFFAHEATDAMPVYHPEKCVGCGSCGQGCPTGALYLEPVSEDEWFHVPSSFSEWEERRLEGLEAKK